MGEIIRLVQISDLHAMNRQGLLHGAGDISSRLSAVAEMAQSIDPAPDAVLLSGDLIDRTSDQGYDEVQDYCRLLGERIGAPVIACMGNHDDRVAFDDALGWLNEDELRRPGDSHDHLRTLKGLRLITLDSTVPGRSYGELTADQLDWLGEVLAEPAERGTVLIFHHPPVASPMPQLRFSGLRNTDDLARVVAGSDVRAILTGHFHHAAASSWLGTLVWCAPALSYTQDVLVPTPRIRGWNRGSFSVIDLTDDAITASVVDIPEPGQAKVLDYDLDIAQKRAQWEEALPG